jgi:hypothetical protein
VGDENKWKDGTSENSIYKGWVVVEGLKHGKYEQWNIPWEWGLYTSENLQSMGIVFHVLECGLRMSGGFLVKLVWLMCIGQGLWFFCDCWTLSFGLSSFLLRKYWLTTSTPKLDYVPIIQTRKGQSWRESDNGLYKKKNREIREKKEITWRRIERKSWREYCGKKTKEKKEAKG